MMKSYLTLAVLWIGWCALHSALISLTVTTAIQKRFGKGFRFYRFFYNTVAIVTIIPVWIYGRTIGSPLVYRWDGAGVFGQGFLLVAAMTLFLAGARHYDLLRFAGLRQLRDGAKGQGLGIKGRLDTTGVLGVTRHPWYMGAITLLWASDADGARMVANIILTGYLVIGAWLEERKLVAEYGDEYREYQERVSMLLPIRLPKRRPNP